MPKSWPPKKRLWTFKILSNEDVYDQQPNGEPFYPVTVAEAVLVSEGETLAAVLQRLEQRIAELEKSEAAPEAQADVLTEQ